jgi:Arc/MetJ-type ribon-helix-helix transcriptional regulator
MHDMDSQVTLRLPEGLMAKLDRMARQMRRNRSEVIRLALEQFLAAEVEIIDKPYDRMRGLIGSFESGVADLGERHREHLIRRLRDAG